MKAGLVIAFLLVLNLGFAQPSARVSGIYTLFPEKEMITGPRYHNSVLPAIRVKYPGDTSAIVILSKQHLVSVSFNPDFAGQFDTSLFYRAAAGVSIETQHNNKWYTRTAVSAGWSTREGQNQIHPAFKPLHDRDEFIYTNIRTRIAYTPNHYFHVAAGIDNQFFGEGYRSLLQSDQAAPNPFALMRAGIWRFEYGLLYQFYHENTPTARAWKFGATHFLSYNVTPNWNITAFESVLFQPKDGQFNRAFEIEYLNPLVFFRPQEYSLGSSDNVILGLQTSYRIKKHTLYGQLLLDEFVLKEIRSRSRWWANKYGAQLGVKGKVGKLGYRLEGNLMRPYTFAHINDGQNGGNQGLPLAHPLGSNFAELLAQVHVPVAKNIALQSYGVFQLKGFDDDSLSWGGDIYQSYLNRPKEYDNTIGQGITLRSVRVGCQLIYALPKWGSHVYLDPQVALQWGDLPKKVTPAVTIGWRSSLFQERKMF